MLETVLTIAGVGVVTQGVAGVAKEVLNMAAAQEVAKVSSDELKAAQELLLAPLAAIIAETQAAAAAFIETAVVAMGAAEAETAMAAATAALDIALTILTGPLGLVILLLATLAAGLMVVGKSVHAFRELQDASFRTGIILSNIKGAASFDQLTAAVNSTADAAGRSRAEFLDAAGVVSKYGVTAAELPRTLQAISDASIGSGRSLREIGLALGHAVLPGGRTMLFSNVVGEEFKKTGDRAKDLAHAIELIEKKFSGATAGRRNTISGAMDALSNATSNLMAALGRVFGSPVWIKFINILANAINLLAMHVNQLLDDLNRLTFGMFAGSRNPAEGIGGKNKGDPEQTALLEEIAGNTSKLDDLVKGVFGESGEAARTGFSLRDARMSFGI